MLTYNFFVESNKDYSNWDIFPFQTTNWCWLLLVQATQSPPQLQQPSAHQTFYPWMAIAGRRYGYSRVLSNFDISVHRYSQHLAMALSLCSKCPQVLSYFVCYNKQAFNQGISTCKLWHKYCKYWCTSMSQWVNTGHGRHGQTDMHRIWRMPLIGTLQTGCLEYQHTAAAVQHLHL